MITARYLALALALAIVAATAQPVDEHVVNTPAGAQHSDICLVLRVRDGDTLHLDCGAGPMSVRLACIDAPELDQPPWGKMALRYLRLVLPPTVQFIPVDKDLYSRSVGTIHQPATGDDLGLRLVTAGLAALDPRYCRSPAYIAERDKVRDEGRGIWGEPGLQQRPWEHRRIKSSKARAAP